MKCKQFTSKVHLSLNFRWKKQATETWRSQANSQKNDSNRNYIMDFLMQIT